MHASRSRRRKEGRKEPVRGRVGVAVRVRVLRKSVHPAQYSATAHRDTGTLKMYGVHTREGEGEGRGETGRGLGILGIERARERTEQEAETGSSQPSRMVRD